MPPPSHFRVRAFAKINLGLKILERRPDGFHQLRTVFQTISLADRVEIELIRGRGIALEVEGDAPAGADNLAHRAAALAIDAFALRRRVRLRLRKAIPTGGGLGGGSADAAAVLRALALAAGSQPQGGAAHARLLALGAALGADVPALLLGGTVLGLGRGDEVYPLADLARWRCVVALPASAPAVSTPAAFAAWDRRHPPGLTAKPNSDTIMEFCSLVQQVLPAFSGTPPNRESLVSTGFSSPGPGASRVHAGIENDFQSEVFSISADFPRIHQELCRAGASWVSLTGSGAAQFGLFAGAETAAATAARLACGHRSWHARFVSRAEYRRGLVIVK